MASSSFLVFLITSLLSLHSCRGDLKLLPKHVPLFIFGDSLFDAGNNNYIKTAVTFKANFRPYGETFFKFPTGRFSDGRLIPDFIAKHANLPLIGPYLHPKIKNYLHGVNFASAGGGALVDTFRGSVIDLQTQLSFFNKVTNVINKAIGPAEAKALLSKAVYFINIGSNDYLAPFLTNSSLFPSHSQQEYVDLVIGNLSSVIEGIHKNGGRKFAFIGVGNLACLPTVKAILLQGKDECFGKLTEFRKLHNKQLTKTLPKLGKKLGGFVYTYADFYSISVEVANNPAKYGFKETKVACCGSGPFRGLVSCGGRDGQKYELCKNPSQYLFFDGTHPTEKANQLVSELLWSGSSKIIRPYNLKALFQAF